ncbi:MAG: prepilin peptidase [Candidatus Omnitrophota bacterium]
MPEFFIGLFVFFFGACIGSFLNVCIVRMPKELSVVTPRSHCFSCQQLIPWYDNIPLVSYFILKGKCRKCGAPFSFRYLLIEWLTAFTFLGFYLYFGLTTQMAAYLVMVSAFIVATFVDFELRIIPDEISVGGMFAGLLLSVFFVDLHSAFFHQLAMGRIIMWIIVGVCLGVHLIEFLVLKRDFDREDLFLFSVIIGMVAAEALITLLMSGPLAGSDFWLIRHLKSLDASLIGLLLGGGVIYVMGLLGDFIFRKESMGGGDVKLMALIGAFLGWKLALVAFFVAPFFGAVYGIIEKIRTKDSAIAYGPFIVMGALISLFFGDVIIAWVLSQYGLTV